MMLLGAVFSKTVASSGMTELTPLDDDKLYTIGNDFRIPEKFNKVMAVYAIGELIKECQIDAPSLRDFGKPYFSPTLKSATTVSDFPADYLGNSDCELKSGEMVKILTSGTAATSKIRAVGIWLSDGSTPIPSMSKTIKVKANATMSFSANSWTKKQLVLETELPYGKYEIVNMRVIAANGLFARLIHSTDDVRPMIPVCHSHNDYLNDHFRSASMGSYGIFENQVPPKIEMCGMAAGSNPEVELEIRKVA